MTISKTLLHEALHAAAIEHMGGKVEAVILRRSRYGQITGGTTVAEPTRYKYFREAYILQAPSLLNRTSPGDDMDLATLPKQAKDQAWNRLQQDKGALLVLAQRIARHYQATGWYRTPQSIGEYSPNIRQTITKNQLNPAGERS